MPLIDDITFVSLASFPQRLEAYFAAFPASLRHWAPASWDGVPSEPLTAIEQICHVRDIEIDGYQERFERTLQESNPVLAAIDTEAFARERAYGSADAAAVLKSFRVARAKTLSLLSVLQSAQLCRTAQFEGYGSVSLAALIHYLCSHDQQHLAGLQWLLGKIESEAVKR